MRRALYARVTIEEDWEENFQSYFPFSHTSNAQLYIQLLAQSYSYPFHLLLFSEKPMKIHLIEQSQPIQALHALEYYVSTYSERIFNTVLRWCHFTLFYFSSIAGQFPLGKIGNESGRFCYHITLSLSPFYRKLDDPLPSHISFYNALKQRGLS